MMPRVSLQLQQVIATQQSMMLPNANATDLDNMSMMGMMRMDYGDADDDDVDDDDVEEEGDDVDEDDDD